MIKNYKKLIAGCFALGLGLLTSINAEATIYNNSASITVVDGAPASAFPSIINVSGLAGTVSNVTVRLNNVSHDYVQDMSVMIQGPNGKTLLLQSGAGDPNSVSNITYTFSDAGTGQLPAVGVFGSGTYKPTGHFWDIWDAPAPPTPPGVGTYYIPGPFNAGLPLSTLATVFNGSNPNGQWRLWVEDFSNGGDPGVISGGWTLDISTAIITPVSLSDFKATNLGCKVGLTWNTSEEMNSSKFEIERSINGSDFETIATLNAKGRSIENVSYSYTDMNITGDAHYEYRLRIVDIDGQVSFSDIVSTDMNCNEQGVSLFPNPVQHTASLMIHNMNTESVTVQITDVFGHTIYSLSSEFNNETKLLSLPVSNFTKGIYMVHVNSESLHETILFSKN